jgi:hypothetical protein
MAAVTTESVRAGPQHRRPTPFAEPIARGRTTFYVALGVLIAAIAFVGFWRTYFGPLLARNVDALPLVHFHVVVYVGWLALFIAQAAFAAAGRVDLHARLGGFGIGYGYFVIAVGLLVGFGMFVVRVRAGAEAEAIGRLFGPVLDMAVFAPVFAAAVHYRRKPELHKRLMILATTTLLVAAVSRMRTFVPSLVFVQLVWSAPLLLAMIYDYATRRIVHPVYGLGLVLLLAESQAVRTPLRASAAWRSFGTWLAAAVQ